MPPALRDVEDLLYRTLAGLASGTVDPKVAVAVANVSRAIVAVSAAGDLEQRILSLEAEGRRAAS